jgi:hypothetical protein
MRLVKVSPKPDHDAFVTAMFLMYARAPKKAEPDPDGSYFLGEVGETAFEDQRLLRDTPYSICKGIRGTKCCE